MLVERLKSENRLKYKGIQNELRKFKIYKIEIHETQKLGDENMGMKCTGLHLKYIF